MLKYLICNLKAHLNYKEILDYKNYLNSYTYSNIHLIIAPTTIYLPLFINNNYQLAIQNLDIYENETLTGNITTTQIKSLGINYAIVGHYDRRKYYQENERIIAQKINLALKNNLKIIYCLGETKEELERQVEYQIIEKQIANVFNNIPYDAIKNIIIAYEPTYLINKQITYNIPKITEMINFIKNLVQDYYNTDIKVVFGGGITPANIKELNQIPNLDGFIICQAVLNPAHIPQLINEITAP